MSTTVAERATSESSFDKKIPIIETVWKRCVVDLIGPLPCSERGPRFILTLVDCASRYPECVAFKQIDTSLVAEARLSIFSRMGVPLEILSDNGSRLQVR